MFTHPHSALSRIHHLLALLLFSLWTSASFAQTPRVFLKFDGDRTDSSGAGIATAVTPNSGFTPTYAADRFGVASKAVVFTGSQSLQIVTGAVNSNEGLGLRNAGGTNTSFTLTAWVYFTSLGSGQGYSTVFGNLGSGAGTLHAGGGSANALAHFGFDGNDANGITTSMVTSQWFHLAFVYNAATQEQRIYINGMPENVRTSVTDTLRATDLYLGNWNTNNNSTNDLKGRLDDVLVYNAALDAGQVQALFNNVNPLTLPAAGTYSAPKLPGFLGFTGTWGVREMKANPNSTNSINGIATGTLVNADRIVRGYTAGQATTTVAEYQAAVINFRDSNSGTSHYFANDAEFGTNTAADDNFLVLIGKCAVRIAAEDDYTFGFRGDDGARLRVLGKQFASSTRLATGNNINPAHHGDGIYFIQGTGDSNTLGVVHLTPGDYTLELTYWEGSGGSSVEVFAARGAKTAVDGAFQLVGDTANGGLPIVRDPDTVPQIQTFTVNGGSTLFIHNNVPANFTLAWQTNAVPTTLAINQGIGSVAIPSGSTNVAAPASTRTYTLTAQNGADTATKNVTVYVNSAPIISSFTADDTTVSTGSPVTLSWGVDGAATLTLNPGGINVTGQTSRVVNPTADTTYTLVATNATGATQQSVSIQVGTGPTIDSFTVADANPLFGAETALAWSVSNATTVSIDQGIGTVASSGTAPVLPVQTTIYTLSATNFYGTTTATATVNQPTPIGIASPGFICRRVSSSVAFPYAPQGYLDSALTLIGETAGGAHFSNETSGTYTTVNFTDGNDGDFTTGNTAFPGGTGDNFAMRVTATLIVNTPGEYTFVVNSDDGARLRIDGVDVILDDGTHGPSASSGRIVLSKPTAQLELIYFDTTGSAECELGWIRPNLSWQLLTVITAAAPIVQGQVRLSELVADNTQLLDEDGAKPDWIEIWNSTAATVNLSGYYLTDDAAIPSKWAFPAWTLGANNYLVAFASLKDRRPAQAVAGQDNPGMFAQPHLHTNFKLNKDGGYLALTKDNGAGGYTLVTVFNPYPPQKEDVSYGTTDSESYLGYMETPTPGQPNAASVLGFVADTKFVDAADGITPRVRGRYTTAFNLAITSSTPGAIIRYTTDGSTPTRTAGTIYTAPIAVAATKVVRAFAYKPGWRAANVDTQTYLFIDDVVTQTTATATALGFPTGPIAPRSQVLRYGMALGNVTAGGGTLQDLKNALATAPTVCMTTDIPNLMNATTGIYANADKHGLFWERPTSIEYLNAAGVSEFQIDCGARIRGGYSRSQNNPKHAFHLYFRGSLYDGNLNYRLFGVGGASEFNQIDMRCEENYSWSFDGNGQNSLMREEWTRLTQGATGQPYARHGHFHLYINGIYWGIYGWEERTEASYGETYLGGIKDNMDVVKSAGSSGGYNTEMTDGNFAAWENLYRQAIALKNDAVSEASRTARYQQMRGLNANGTPNAAYPVLLNADNLIDYLLIVFFDGSFDSPMSTFLSNASNNWFGVRDRAGARGFSFYIHDHEHGMESVSDGRAYNRTGPWGGLGLNEWGQLQYNTRESLVNTFYSKSNPQYLHELLAYSAEYRQRFADRVQRHFFNGGALTTASAIARINTLVAEVDPIIHAEAARWGSGSLNKTSWTNAKNTINGYVNTGGAAQGGFTNFGAQSNGRNSLIIQQLQGYQDPVGTAKPLAATLAAPVFSGQFGGIVGNPYPFNITNPNGATGTLYYSVNGADPRDFGGGVNASALTGASGLTVTLTSTATVQARVYNGGAWSALTEAQYLVGALAFAGNLAISQIHYNPAGSGNLTQFVEVMNIGAQTIDLTNVHFTLGIQFTFAASTLLAPGARLVVVRDQAAFTAAYPTVPGAQIAGVFANGTTLDTGGERLQLLDASNAVIRDFSYNNKDPWPESPDGNGPSLVLLRPTTNPDHSLGINWRASYAIGGSPGADDALSYNTWAGTNGITDLIGIGDDDGDGYFNLVEYALGMNPHQSSTAAKPVVATQAVNVLGVVSDYLTITITRPIGRDDVSYAAEGCTAVNATWTPAILIAPPTFNGNGTETLTWRHANPKTGNPQQFLHLRITRLP